MKFRYRGGVHNNVLWLFLFSLQIILVFNNRLYSQQFTIPEEKTKTDILRIYDTKGEESFRKYAKEHKDSISIEFLTKLKRFGKNQHNENILKATLILAEENEDKKAIADVYLFYSYCYQDTGNEKVISYAEKAQKIYMEIGDSEGMGFVYELLGSQEYYQSKNEEALELYNKALHLFEKSNSFKGLSIIYSSQADVYFMMDNNKKAQELYSESLTFAKKANDSSCIASGYMNLGKIFFNICENEKAIEMYNNALQIFETVKNNIGVGNCYENIGNVYDRMDEKDKAIEMYYKALPYFEKSKASLSIGNVYNDLGKTLFWKGELDKSLEMYSQALPYYEMGNYVLNIGNIYRKQGQVSEKRGNYYKAIELYSIAIKIFEKTNAQRNLANVLISLGEMYYDIGSIDKASEYFLKALPIFIDKEDGLGIGNVYHHQGIILIQKDSLDKALKNFEIALPYYEKANSIINQALVFEGRGDAYSKKRQYDTSLENYSKALSLLKISNSVSGIGNIYKGMGDLYFQKKENEKAIDYYEKAVLSFTEEDFTISKALTLLSEAKVYALDKNLDSAYQKFNKGETLMESIRNTASFSDLKISLMENIFDFYQQAVLFTLENGKLDKAFSYSEKMKSRTFLDQVAEKSSNNLDKGLNQDLLKKRNDLTAKYSSIKIQIENTEDEKKLVNLKAEQRNLEGEIEKLIQEIRFQNPSYAMVQYPKTVELQEIQKKLKSLEAVIEYFVSDSTVYSFVITKENYKVIKLPFLSTELEKEIISFNKSLTIFQSHVLYESKLYSMLIEPVAKYLKDTKELVIIPDGKLTSLPFEAIITDGKTNKERPEYLIEKYAIKYFQSATYLCYQRDNAKGENKKDNFIGIGDPVYDYENYLAGKTEKGERIKKEDYVAQLKGEDYERSGGLLNRLEGSGEEVEEVSKYFKEKKVLTRLEASEENIKKEEMKNYKYILLSCHGLANDNFQSVVLSQLPNTKEDGYLTLDEIMNLDWNADMVVLSACKTGTGTMKRGEGVIGLTRAIMYAGTPTAVVSLWNVDVGGTKQLMVGLFRYLVQNKLSKEKSLRRAKLAMLEGKYDNPFYWSSFIMYGE